MSNLNYLIVMPRFVDKIGEWYNFPLGIPYVSSSLKKSGFNVYTLNLNNMEGTISDVLRKDIREKDIDVVMTGGLSFQYNAIKSIIHIAKNIKPNLITIVGGGIITSAPEAAMEALEFVDYGVIGEGEITSCELCCALEADDAKDKIDGIIYKQADRYHRTNSRKEIAELDTIAYPDYKGFGFDIIMNMVACMQGINESNAITMLSSRSCPFQCTFCFHSSGQKYRQRSLDSFFRELDFLVQEYGVKYIFIADELFAYNMDRVKEFCMRIKQYDVKWWAQFRVSDVTADLVDLLKDSNCATMGFGLESADNRILKSMKKGITIDQTEKALQLVYEAGIAIQGGFIFGDVEETLETAKNTLEWWKEHSHYGATLNFITTFPGTALYNFACKNGIIKDEVEFIKQGCPTINVSKMSQEEIAWLSEQIIMLPQAILEEPKDIKDVHIDYNNANISFNGNCVHCGFRNNWKNIRFFTRNVLPCSKCGRKHKVPILNEISQAIDANVDLLLQEYDRIAFWGINDYFYDLSSHLKSVADDDVVYYVDISRSKQGSTVNNKKIYSPEIVSQQEIKLIIVPAISFFTMIEQQIKDEFPNVKHVINILDLIR